MTCGKFVDPTFIPSVSPFNILDLNPFENKSSNV